MPIVHEWSTKQAMDPLSAMLRALRLTGALFLDARFTAPWCVTAHMSAEDCAPWLSSPAQLIAYHVVLEGSLVVRLPDGAGMAVRAGEIVLFPRNNGHLLAHADPLAPRGAPVPAPVSAGSLIRPGGDGRLASIEHGGGGAPTRVVCGFLGGADPPTPLFAALPGALKVDLRATRGRDFVETSVRFAAEALLEGGLPTAAVMARLAETLLISAVRDYAAGLPGDAQGWLAGLADPPVARALALIHAMR